MDVSKQMTKKFIKQYIRKSGPFLPVVICGLLAAWVVYFPLTNTDIWWHLAAGREMLQRKAFLYTDPFAFSVSNAKWIDLHWFFQIIVYGLHSLGGAPLLIWTKLSMVFAAVLIISSARKEVWYKLFSAAILSVLLFHARFLVLMRPILITITAMALFIVILERYSKSGKSRILLWMIPVQLVWTNSQGLFILGPVILGCYWLGELMKTIFGCAGGLQSRNRFRHHIRLTAALPMLCATTVINPYGIEGALFPFSLFSRIDPSHANIYSRNISENVPLMDLSGPDAGYVYAVMAVTALTLISFFVNRKKAQWSHVLLTAAFFSLAFMAKRNILLYFFVAAPVLAVNITDSLTALRLRSEKAGRTVAYVCAGVLMILIIHNSVLQARVTGHYPRHTMISPFRIPEKAVEYLQRNPAPGAMFNTVRYGGYLIWTLYPSREVFIDGRLIIRSPKFFADYLAVCGEPEKNFPDLARRYSINHALLPTAVFAQSMPLVKYLYERNDWKVVYADGASILFRTSNLTNEKDIIDLSSDKQIGKILSSIEQQWSDHNLIKMQYGIYLEQLLRYLGNEDQAENVKKSVNKWRKM